MFGLEFGAATAWWSNQTAGIVGGIAGSALGLFGALTGVLGGQGKALGFLVKAWQTLFVLGIASLIIGVAAVIMGQPYAVYYPLLLMGFLISILSPMCVSIMRQRKAQSEIRQMDAQDAS